MWINRQGRKGFKASLRARFGGVELVGTTTQLLSIEPSLFKPDYGASSGASASFGIKPTSLAISPPLATVTCPALAQGTSSFHC